jgi:uridine kinase
MAPERTLIVGIAGPSGSGKSTVARRLAASLGAGMVSMESYYRDLSALPIAERERKNFDSPDALDAALLVRQVKDFSEGKDIQAPVYDFAAHTRLSNKFELIASGPILIVEGILVLNWPELRSRFSLSFYLDAADDVCFQRRMVRDIVERQRSHEFVRRQYRETVLPMAIQYVYPTKAFASFVVDAAQDIPVVEEAVLSRVHSHPQGRVAARR